MAAKFSTKMANCLSSQNKYLKFRAGEEEITVTVEEICRYSDVIVESRRVLCAIYPRSQKDRS